MTAMLKHVDFWIRSSFGGFIFAGLILSACAIAILL